jgi:hypothetical protein
VEKLMATARGISADIAEEHLQQSEENTAIAKK